MVRIGIIGVGGIAGFHIHELLNQKEARITAICDIDEEKLRRVGDRLDIPEEYRFVDYRDLIACAQVDAVEICTPNYLHIPMAIDAAKAGKPVEVEKPLGADYGNADELLAVLEEKQLPGMMCFSYRFRPAVRYAKRLLEKGLLGEIINANVAYLKSSAFWEGRRLDWRFVKEYAGSGVLGDLGVHLIDMTSFLLGDFKRVYAMEKTVVKERQRLDSDEWAKVETDDITAFIAELENDVFVNFLVTRCAIGNENTILYEIYGTNGVIQFNLNTPDELKVCIGEVDKETDGLHTIKVPARYGANQEECFVKAALGEKPEYYPDIREGAKCQKVVDALLKSAKERVPVEL